MAFVKYFKPLDCFIGTGEYLDDVEKDIQKEVLTRIQNIRFDNDGYIFIGQYDGLSLLEPGKGKNMYNVEDVNGIKIVQELINAAKKGGDFVLYTLPPFPDYDPLPKISYANGIDEWKWYVGTGVYVDYIDKLIEEKRKELQKEIAIQIIGVLILSSIIFSITLLLTLILSNRLKKETNIFINFFKESVINNKKIDCTNLKFDDFKVLGNYANDMIKQKSEADKKLKKLNNELEKRVHKRTEELEASNKELESFAYSVSHDLRAPLRHISGFTEILKGDLKNEQGINPEAKKHFNMILSAAENMSSLIDSLLDFSRMSRSELSFSLVNLEQLINNIMVEFDNEIKKRSISVIIDNLPEVNCDHSMIKQVFINLLSNAIKYTRNNNKAKIEIGTKPTTEKCYVFFIKDNGVGFDMEYANKLFNVFQRLHDKKEFDGTGVGLAIVKRIIEKHGGKVWAEAKVNKGATFYFSLPL